MKYTETGIDGVTVVDIEPHNHERGLFARSFCADEFAKNGLDSTVAQVNFAYTPRSAARCADCTGRCRHSAKPNWCDVRAGAIFAVAVDIRRESATFSKQETVELTAENRRALVLPPYVAHGFQTLADDTEAMYQVSGPYEPRGEQGFRWDDPEFNIAWPLPITVISEKDASWPLIAEVSCLSR